ncbi:MAG TPA: hypothetical protein DIW47_04105 [Bacteroidetes bacterium]|nr:hypothetical protein [Bacteroidota bacterium]
MNAQKREFIGQVTLDSIEGTYDNQLDSSRYSLLILLGNTDTAETVTISFIDQAKILFEYGTTGHSDTFDCELKNNYLEFYVSRVRRGIPPIYSNTRINRIRIFVEDSNTIKIVQYLNYGGTRFLMAAGYKTTKTYHAKKRLLTPR